MKKVKRKTVTMADIARKVGVSTNAVSLALSNKPGIGPALREQIVEAAQHMRYRMPAEKTARQACLVVVVPEYIRDDGSFYSDIFWAIEHETRKLGHTTLTAGLSREAEHSLTPPSVPDGLEALGYLAVGIIRKEYMERLTKLGRPVVSVDIHNGAVAMTSVGSDNLYGGWLATEHLIEAGHTRIGFAGPIYSAQSVYERWCGYMQALLQRGIEPDPALWIHGRRDTFELLDSAQTLNRYLERLPALPTAWFCAGDMIAVSMYQLMSARGLSIPGDISVMGFDDLKIAEMLSPPLSTVQVNRKMMGKLGVELLLGHTQGAGPEENLHVTIPCALATRASVARPREA